MSATGFLVMMARLLDVGAAVVVDCCPFCTTGRLWFLLLVLDHLRIPTAYPAPPCSCLMILVVIVVVA